MGNAEKRAASYPQSCGKYLLTFTHARYAEIDSALIVRLGRGWNIQVSQRNLLRMLRSEGPQRLAHNGVILHFLLVLIAEHQHRGWRCFRSFFLARRSRVRTGIRILIALLAHPLLLKALRIHLVRLANLA